MAVSFDSSQNCQSLLSTSVSHIRSLLPPLYKPTVGIIGGSGLSALESIIRPFDSGLENDLEIGLEGLGRRVEISFDNIPGFPTPTVSGHSGKLICGTIITRNDKKINVVLMSGRGHFYEGNDARKSTFPIRVLGALGLKALVVTNAAGGLNRTYSVGDIVVLSDHISLPSLTGSFNPLHGPVDMWNGAATQRFLALSDAYDFELRKSAWRAWRAMCNVCNAAKSNNVERIRGTVRTGKLQEGIYAFVAGPTYETRAEARFLSNIGADVVGMSTVPEVIVARHIGLRVLGLSLVTNMVVLEEAPRGDDRIKNADHVEYDIADGKANHGEVLEAGRAAAQYMSSLIVDILDLELNQGRF